ncbi:MAG: GDP-mannose 4,6-dehydratase [Planctomycetota bacterium]
MAAVLVTGGAGFIGSHLSQRLLEEGSDVRVLDCIDSFYEPTLKRANLELLEQVAARTGSSLEVVEGDLRDADVCRRALDGVGCLVHLAALAGVRPSLQDPIRYVDVNVTGTQTLLEQITDPAVRVVFGSSSSVYGGNERVPFSEEHAVDRPVSPYAATKKAGEVLCYTWHHLHGNPVTCLRFFTVYGPRQRPEMAIHKFARMITNGETLPLFGDGTTRRDYTYVDDIVAGVLAATQRVPSGAADAAGAGDPYRIYNLGGAATTSLSELVQLLEDALGQKAKIERLPDQPGDVRQTYADVSRAERELGYRSRTSLADGVQKFCRWYLEEKQAGRIA